MPAGLLSRVYFDKNEDGVFGRLAETGPAYQYEPYPRVKYHATQPPETVNDEEEEKSLGAGWGDVPIRSVDGDKREPSRRVVKVKK